MATYVQPKYTLTRMRNGKFRGECHLPDCGWWVDRFHDNVAKADLRTHMVNHGVRVNLSKVMDW